mgnify:CR=1 FL=1
MNWLDYTILSIITIFTLYGAARGFIHGLFSVGGLIISIIVAKKYYAHFAEFLIEKTGIEDVLLSFIEKNKVTEAFAMTLPFDKGFNDIYQYITIVIINCIGILLVFMAARICLSLLEVFLKEVFRLPVLSTINHSFGALLGFTHAVLIILICFAIFMPLASLEKFDFIHQAISNSLLSKYFYQYNFIFGWALNTTLNIFIK